MIFHNGRLIMGQGRAKVTVTISANTQNYVFNPSKVPGYVAGLTDATLVIDAGVVVSASATSAYALAVEASWATGDKVFITNNGTIHGAGGAGGPTVNGPGVAGSPGGPAFSAGFALTMNNYGIIAGGGGGGGSGCAIFNVLAGGQGGVGAGAPPGTGGNGYDYLTVGTGGLGGTAGNPGQDGTDYPAANDAGTGGGGGGWGAKGGQGGLCYTVEGGVGGAGGAAVVGNGNITWASTGTIYGALT